jgi:hypothetical protein
MGKQDGTRQLARRTAREPAEYERVVWGRALMPQPEQRVIRIDGVELPPSEYTCDNCLASIKPGELCCAWSAWVYDDMPEWEGQFIMKEQDRGPVVDAKSEIEFYEQLMAGMEQGRILATISEDRSVEIKPIKQLAQTAKK